MYSLPPVGTRRRPRLLLSGNENGLPPHPLLPLTTEQAWEEIQDDVWIALGGDEGFLDVFYELHAASILPPGLLVGVARIVSHHRRRLHGSVHDPNEAQHSDDLPNLARFLAVGSRTKKRDATQVVMVLIRCCCCSSDDISTTTASQLLDFITTREVVTPPIPLQAEGQEDTSYRIEQLQVLWWELRALCLREVESTDDRIQSVTSKGDTTALMISASAHLVEQGMRQSVVPALSRRIVSAGAKVKEQLPPSATHNQPGRQKGRDEVVALVYSDAMRRASHGAKESSRQAVQGIVQVSSKGVNYVASKVMTRQSDAAQQRRNAVHAHHPEGLAICKAVTKVGLASVGAAAMVSDALVTTSRAVLHQTTLVTADVVHHTCGSTAGTVLQHAGETTSNWMKVAGNVAMMEQTVLAKAVAKEAGKAQVQDDSEQIQETMGRLKKQATKVMAIGGWNPLSSSAAILDDTASSFTILSTNVVVEGQTEQRTMDSTAATPCLSPAVSPTIPEALDAFKEKDLRVLDEQECDGTESVCSGGTTITSQTLSFNASDEEEEEDSTPSSKPREDEPCSPPTRAVVVAV